MLISVESDLKGSTMILDLVSIKFKKRVSN